MYCDDQAAFALRLINERIVRVSDLLMTLLVWCRTFFLIGSVYQDIVSIDDNLIVFIGFNCLFQVSNCILMDSFCKGIFNGNFNNFFSILLFGFSKINWSIEILQSLQSEIATSFAWALFFRGLDLFLIRCEYIDCLSLLCSTVLNDLVFYFLSFFERKERELTFFDLLNFTRKQLELYQAINICWLENKLDILVLRCNVVDGEWKLNVSFLSGLQIHGSNCSRLTTCWPYHLEREIPNNFTLRWEEVNACTHLHVGGRRCQIVSDIGSSKDEIIDQGINQDTGLLVENLDFSTLPVGLIDPDIEIFLERGGRVLKEEVGQAL